MILKSMGGQLPYTDALSTVISVVAMVVGVQMYMEKWVLWIVYLLNGYIMYFQWKREALR